MYFWGACNFFPCFSVLCSLPGLYFLLLNNVLNSNKSVNRKSSHHHITCRHREHVPSTSTEVMHMLWFYTLTVRLHKCFKTWRLSFEFLSNFSEHVEASLTGSWSRPAPTCCSAVCFIRDEVHVQCFVSPAIKKKCECCWKKEKWHHCTVLYKLLIVD